MNNQTLSNRIRNYFGAKKSFNYFVKNSSRLIPACDNMKVVFKGQYLLEIKVTKMSNELHYFTKRRACAICGRFRAPTRLAVNPDIGVFYYCKRCREKNNLLNLRDAKKT
jgi:hypothetical protein